MPITNAGFNDPEGVPGWETLALRGPTLAVRVGFDANFTPDSIETPDLPGPALPALIDTGASEICVDEELARALELPLVERRYVSGAGGVYVASVYVGQIYIPELRFSTYGALVGVNLRAGVQPHFVLLGRAFLQNFTMTYEGRTGIVTLSND